MKDRARSREEREKLAPQIRKRKAAKKKRGAAGNGRLSWTYIGLKHSTSERSGMSKREEE